MNSLNGGIIPDDKGKSKAHVPAENTPLLASSSHSYSLVEPPSTVAVSNRRLRSKLLRVFCFSLLSCLFLFAALALLTWSYASKASSIPPEEIIATSVFFRHPSQVNVIKVEQGTLWVRLEGKLGVDAGSILGTSRDPEGDGFFTSIWKSVGRWGVRRLDKVTVRLSPIHITPVYDTSLLLASVSIEDLDVPLNPDPPPDKSWLSDVTVNLAVKPTTNASALLEFVKGCWAHGAVDVRANVDEVLVKGGALYERSWRNVIRIDLAAVRVPLRFKIPHLPGLPKPGEEFPSLEKLIKLQEFDVTSQNDTMSITARATIVNPLPEDISITVPSLPFAVSIPSSNETAIPVASVSTAPFTLTHPNITLDISGTVLPLPSASSHILSNFLMRYLSARSNLISISTPLLPGLPVLTTFPGPNPRPQLLRNVTIRDMKVKPKGDTLVADGIVFVNLVLPKGINVALDIQRIFPDVIVSDGEVVEGLADVPEEPLPDPLPDNAFGHIRPDHWLPSLCIRERANEGDGATYSISAAFHNIPLGVLPGREKQFSNFVSKVIFGPGGALAGIVGSASAMVNVEGLPVNSTGHHPIQFDGLPFRGTVRVGNKSGIFSGQDLD